ncbi:MAG: alpha/beta hydrolase [Bacteroidota bacterium]
MPRLYAVDALDPELRPLARALPPPDYSNLAAAREGVRQMARFGPPVDVSQLAVTDSTVPGFDGAPDVPVRVYAPEPETAPEAVVDGRRPALVFMHWGGFVLGDLNTEHARCARLARAVGAVVVSVDYRLAPEHPYPAGLDDSHAALAWVHSEADALGVDRERIAVGGTSAGAGLAAALALRARDARRADPAAPAVAFQYLGYPVLDDRCQTGSARAYTDTPNWSAEANRRMWDLYLAPEDRDAPPATAAPARARDLDGLPAAYLWTAEFDPLRDEGADYAQVLAEAGVEVEHHAFARAVHGFDAVPGSPLAARAQAEQEAALRSALWPERPEPAAWGGPTDGAPPRASADATEEVPDWTATASRDEAPNHP